MSVDYAVVGSRTALVEAVFQHGENGILVDFFKPDSLPRAVAYILYPGTPETHAEIT